MCTVGCRIGSLRVQAMQRRMARPSRLAARKQSTPSAAVHVTAGPEEVVASSPAAGAAVAALPNIMATGSVTDRHASGERM